jgi:hypothetical protein
LLNKTDEKIIFFCKSLKYGFELYQKFKDNAYLYCSQNKKNDKYLQHAKLDCIKENEQNKTITFDKRLLITTSALDNGIDIIDRNVKHLITDIWDFDIMVQCLGRKRPIDNTDWCNFYIRNYSNKQLGNIKGGLGNILNPATMFKEDKDKFKETYLKNDRQFHNTLLYNDPKSTELKLNLVKFNKMKIDYKTLDKWIEKNYKYYLVCLFDVKENNIQVVDSKMSHELSKEEILIKYIDNIVGQELRKEEQAKLKEAFNEAGLKDRTMGINTLNGKLLDEELPFIIKTERNKSSRWWKVYRLTDK